eukprot:scaffold243918_cov59-Attheya_sp.AAC.4
MMKRRLQNSSLFSSPRSSEEKWTHHHLNLKMKQLQALVNRTHLSPAPLASTHFPTKRRHRILYEGHFQPHVHL